ncbi:MAG: hypothetical protein NZ750_10605 [Anaerolineae bacterium]|nr:hypothetical protein [Anaerolineae bacterium]MDW8173864.1 hypothetical protein [Anaerolineae bacterium]
MLIRSATLDDAQAIVRLACAAVPRWQRLNESGLAEDVPYEALSIYERWQHGGPWMSLETAVLWLNHLLRGAGLPLVVLDDAGHLLAYAEAFFGDEPHPFGKHLHLADLRLAEGAPPETAAALLAHLSKSRQRLTISILATDDEARERCQALGFAPLASVRHWLINTQSGQGFYKASPHLHADPAQIQGWAMPIGRTSSARQAWETLWTRLWDALPAIAQQAHERLSFSASGQTAFISLQARLYDPRTADVSCWTAKPLTPALLTALRDWGQRQGYKRLGLALDDATAKLLPADAEATPLSHLTLTYAP